MRRPRRSFDPSWWAFVACAGVALAAFGWMVTFGTFRFVAPDAFGSFYDHQAAAWLAGRWDVPEPAVSSEAFVVNQKTYGYFGPTPALLRLPLVALGLGFGAVTRLFMLLDYAACLAGAYALLRLAARWRDAAAVPRPALVVLLVGTAGLGSSLFFLGSRAYVYHEAILCGAAFGIWGVYYALRHLQAPTGRAWIGALLCGLGAVHARPPIGLFALLTLGGATLVACLPAAAGETPPNRWHQLRIGALSVLAVLSFNLVSYIKFGTMEGAPMRFAVQYTPEDIAALDHRNFHFSNLRFNSHAYLLRPSFSVSGQFPYVYREYIDRKKYPESRMAYRDPTLAIPWSMPGLFALSVTGSILAAATAAPLRQPLGVLWLAAAPASLALLTAVAVTQRYTADFCPWLIATAAFAVAAIDQLAAAPRHLALGGAAFLAVLGLGVTGALTLHHQRHIVWGVPDEVRLQYERWRTQADAFIGRSP